MFGLTRFTAALVLASQAMGQLASALPAMLPVEPVMTPRRRRTFVRSSRLGGPGSIALGNRHTGRPHEHRREIARRTGRPA